MDHNHRLTDHQQATLLRLARDAIVHGLEWRRAPEPRPEDFDPPLRQARATFVTLRREARLRGCIGSLEAYRPLVVDVAENAFAAAFRDPRFEPLQAAELAGLEIHIAILSPSEPLEFTDEADLLRRLRPGLDGLTIAFGTARATFLPAVWESLPNPGEFLRALKSKAGLEGVDTADCKAWRYSAIDVPSPAQLRESEPKQA